MKEVGISRIGLGKNENQNLLENRELAFGTLNTLINKMKNNPELVKQYDSVIQHQQKFGVIERIKSESNNAVKHYIPHHAVVNPLKKQLK